MAILPDAFEQVQMSNMPQKEEYKPSGKGGTPFTLGKGG